MRKLERFANWTAKSVNDGFMRWPKWRCIMKILKGFGKYWHPNEDPSGKHDCNFSNRNLQCSATLAKRLCRGGVLVISASCIPFYIHVQLAIMLSFHTVQHAQIEKCIPRRFCIKQNNQIGLQNLGLDVSPIFGNIVKSVARHDSSKQPLFNIRLNMFNKHVRNSCCDSAC